MGLKNRARTSDFSIFGFTLAHVRKFGIHWKKVVTFRERFIPGSMLFLQQKTGYRSLHISISNKHVKGFTDFPLLLVHPHKNLSIDAVTRVLWVMKATEQEILTETCSLPSNRIWTSDLEIMAFKTTVSRSTNWAIEGWRRC